MAKRPRMMDRRVLGSTGIAVSRILLGCGSIGGIGSPVSTRGKGLSPEEGRDQIDSAVRLGVNVLDTANSYAGGESERVVGEWLADHPDTDVLVETKVGNIVDPGQEAIDLSPGHIARQVEVSLGRLGRIDLYLCHAPDERTPIEDTLEAFAVVLDARKARAFGVSNFTRDQLEQALMAADRLGLPGPAFVQNEYNLLARDDEAGILRLVREHGLGYTPYSPLAGGVLAGRYRRDVPSPPDSRLALAPGAVRLPDAGTFSGLERMAVEAQRRGVSTAGLALAWVLSAPDVTGTLVAPRRPDQWDAVGEAMELELKPDERDQLARLFA